MRVAVGCVVGVLAVAGAGPAAAQSLRGDWTTEGGGAARTGAIKEPTFSHLTSRTGLAWVFPLGTPAAAGVVIAGERVLAADTAGRVHALDLLTGCPEWRFELGEPVLAAVSAEDGRFAVAGRDGALAVGALADGSVRWRCRLASGIEGAPLWLGGRLVVATRGGAVAAFDRAGTEVWRATVGAPCFAALAGAGDTVVGVAVDGTCRAFAADTGALRWQQAIGGGACYAMPAIAGGRVYTVAGDGTAAAWKLADGTRLFRVTLAGPASASPAVGGGRFYVCTEGGECWAFDAETGTPVWQWDDAPTGIRAALVVGPRWLMLTLPDGQVQFCGAEERILRRTPLQPAVGGKRPMLAAPALHAGGCVGIRADGLVFAQRDASGDRRVAAALLGLPTPMDAVDIAVAAQRLNGPAGAQVARDICASGEVALRVLDEVATAGRRDLREAAARWRAHLSYLTGWIEALRVWLMQERRESVAQWRARRRKLWRTFLTLPEPDVVAAALDRWRRDGGTGLDDFDPLWPVATRRQALARLGD